MPSQGTVTRQLVPHFETVHGVDISSEMYSSAIPQPNIQVSDLSSAWGVFELVADCCVPSHSLQYRTGSASDLSFLADGSVDLVTAGTSRSGPSTSSRIDSKADRSFTQARLLTGLTGPRGGQR